MSTPLRAQVWKTAEGEDGEVVYVRIAGRATIFGTVPAFTCHANGDLVRKGGRPILTHLPLRAFRPNVPGAMVLHRDTPRRRGES